MKSMLIVSLLASMLALSGCGGCPSSASYSYPTSGAGSSYCTVPPDAPQSEAQRATARRLRCLNHPDIHCK
jgi:hypothetical protein